MLCAVLWGAPDVWLAQAARRVGPLAVVFGSILVGTLLLAPAAAFVATPDWTARGVGLGVLAGVLSVVAYLIAYTAFRHGAVSVVAPIISCEGAVAAAIALGTGERLDAGVLVLLGVATAGVVLAAMGVGGGRGGALPAAVAACMWGGILVLSDLVADDLGVFWGFFLIRVVALAAALALGLARSAAGAWLADRWRIAVWGVADTGAYLLFVAAADSGPVAVASVLAAQFATVAVLVAVLSGERPLRRQLAGVALVIASVSAIAAVGG
jgi:hypothetical protein